MDNRQRMVTELTEQELIQIFHTDPARTEGIRQLFIRGAEQIKEQIQLINASFDSFTQRSGVLMTVAGLISFLLPLVSLDSGYLEHFLVWTFPLLIMTLVAFYLSSPRVNAVATNIPTAIEGTIEHFLILKAELAARELIWRKSKLLYDRVLEWYRITSALVYIYLVSFALNFYFFTFVGVPEKCQSLVMLLLSVGVGVFTYMRHKLRSNKDLNFGPHTPLFVSR